MPLGVTGPQGREEGGEGCKAALTWECKCRSKMRALPVISTPSAQPRMKAGQPLQPPPLPLAPRKWNESRQNSGDETTR